MATLKAVAHLSNGTTQDVTSGTQWTVSSSSLATIGGGTLTGKSPGTVSVQGTYVAPASSSQWSTTQPLSSSAQVTIDSASAGDSMSTPLIKWNTPPAIQYGTPLSSTQLNATANVPGSFAYATTAGTVLKAGTQTLSATFTPADPNTYSAATASVELTVTKATPIITWSALPAISQGVALSGAQLNASANVPGSFMYSPAAGTLLAAGTRPLTATFSPSDSSNYTSATAANSLTVKAGSTATGTTAPLITWSTPKAIEYGTALSSVQLSATTTVPGVFVYTPATGTVLKAGTQSLSVTFTATDTNTYSVATGKVQLVVTKATPVVAWGPLSNITQGTALGTAQLDAKANVQGVFSYNPAPGTVLPVGSRVLTATFSPTDATDYAAVTANDSITVSAAPGHSTPTITWSAPPEITYGTRLGNTQLKATANTAGTFAYTPATGAFLRAGTQKLSVTFTPTDTKTYSAVAASVEIVVAKAKPTITWATPAPVKAGSALSATQLDAAASLPGSLTYSPVVGTVLSAGTHTLTVEFSPIDGTDYSPATAQVSLSVTAPSAPPPTPTPPPTPPPAGCGGPTINLNSGMSTSTLQSTISSAPSCALIIFGAGTYNITAPLTLKCGATYTGPAVPIVHGLATPTAILDGSGSGVGQGSGIFTFYSGSGPSNPCTQPTTVEYLNFHAAQTGIFVETPFTNLTIQYNTCTSIPGLTNQSACLVSASVDTNSNSAAELTNTTITHNQFGDNNSCISPTNVMADTDSPEDYEGACNGMVFFTSINGLTVTYNNFNHVAEGVHINCPGYVPVGGNVNGVVEQFSVCEPPGGALTENMTVRYNDFNNIHRIPWEEQPQQTGGIDFEFNSFHDWVSAYFGSFGVSFACCYNGTQFQPNFNGSNNVILFNATPTPNAPGYTLRYGYGMEAMGNAAIYDNELVQSTNYSPCTNGCGAPAPAMVYGRGPVAHMDNNTVCGGAFAQSGAGYIVTEGLGALDNTPTLVGNVFSATCSAITSVAPSISPAASSQSFPLVVTLADAGYTSGSQPLGNTGIWYTTDGSTPVPGSGTAQRLDSGGTFVLSAAATVKAVGMWGAANQPPSYPSGYGFAPSNVIAATYSAGAAVKRPVGVADASISPTAKIAAGASAELPAGVASATLESVTITPSQVVVGIGSSIQVKAVATFNDGSVKDITADFGWQSSDARTIKADASGTVAGLASGQAVISGSYQGQQASVPASSTIGEVAWNGPLVISVGGTYSGNWQSTDSKTPAVTVATTDPVTIENSRILGTGALITTSVAGSKLTVRNTVGVALNAAVKGQPNGKFLEVTSPARLDVENNYIENAQGGVIVHGFAENREGEPPIVIRANRARNLNGMLSDGHGGYLPGEKSNFTQAHFVQFDTVQSVPGVDVGWNEVINYPGQSLVDDNIDLYRSSGTPNQPVEIHDTYIQGAYPYKAQDAYTGGGIKIDAKAGDSTRDVPAFNSIHDNQVVGTTNYGIQFGAGHDNVAANNRVISSGLLADGTKIAAQQVGMANSDATGTGMANGSMYNNSMHDNLIGWACWQASCAKEGYRRDESFPAAPADYSANSVVDARQITLDMENNEYQVWQAKMASAGISVGPSF